MSAPEMAIKLGARRIPSFPCNGTNKRPTCPNGFYDAECDADALHALWEKHPGRVIGVPTGERSGISVVDLDLARHPDCVEWYGRKRALLGSTRIHATRSGGVHFLYKHSPEVVNSEGKRVKGVDTRGRGGYFIFWPAAGCEVLNKAPLAPWPSWISEWLWPPPPPRKPREKVKELTEGEARDYATLVVSRVLSDLRSASNGQRHYMLRRAACTIGGFMEALGLSEDAVVNALVDAVEAAGAEDIAGAKRTAVWGIKRGRQKPLEIEGRS
jgi:hypothetical protein